MEVATGIETGPICRENSDFPPEEDTELLWVIARGSQFAHAPFKQVIRPKNGFKYLIPHEKWLNCLKIPISWDTVSARWTYLRDAEILRVRARKEGGAGKTVRNGDFSIFEGVQAKIGRTQLILQVWRLLREFPIFETGENKKKKV